MTTGTNLHLGILVGPATEITVTDNPVAADIVAIYFDGTFTCIQGDLGTLSRLVDEAAHQLMLISHQRCQTEDAGERERGVAHVNGLRDAAADARAEAVR